MIWIKFRLSSAQPPRHSTSSLDPKFPRPSNVSVPLNIGAPVKTLLTAVAIITTTLAAGCVATTLAPGAAQVRIAHNSSDVAGCKAVGNVGANYPNHSRKHKISPSVLVVTRFL
jgi:hypothetical protein